MAEERDQILDHLQSCFLQDGTNGNIRVFVGPIKVPVTGSDSLVIYDDKRGCFVEASADSAIQSFISAGEGEYIVLENPAKDENKAHPTAIKENPMTELQYGRKIIIPGPDRFPLWPGQLADVIQGHFLRSDQYLMVRITSETLARENIDKIVIKPAAPIETAPTEQAPAAEEPEKKGKAGGEQAPEGEHEATPVINEKTLSMGQIYVIKGTDSSFFIPASGMEVMKDGHGNFVREAVTLERLEYCILLDESGNKRYVQGPAVVFPLPTETFVVEGGKNKFRAIELDDDMAVYVKVIAEYVDDDGRHQAGEELFITGKKQKIYYPRPEHAVIKVGDTVLYKAVAIPQGEARYVLNKETGSVTMMAGPKMFLPDPRKEVIVRRILDAKTIELYYPGNREALEHNARLRSMSRPGEHLTDDEVHGRSRGVVSSFGAAEQVFAAEEITRSAGYSEPPTVTLDTKYAGAVRVKVHNGYAVTVVNNAGDRKVVVGPKTILLQYDETLEALELSTDTPKSTDVTLKTVYLKINNRVSDIVEAVTEDMVGVKVSVSYRVNFTGDSSKWFDSEDYVGLLTDHFRSRIRNEVTKHGIEHFYSCYIDIIRDCVLGAKPDDTARSGRTFEENDMQVYDVEVLGIVIGDREIADILMKAQHASVTQAVNLQASRRVFETTKEAEAIKRKTAAEQAKTAKHKLTTDAQVAEMQKQADLAKAADDEQVTIRQSKADAAKAKVALEVTKMRQAITNFEQEAALARQKAQDAAEVADLKAKQDLEKELMTAQVEAFVTQVKAVNDNLAKAITAFGDKELVGKLVEHLGPQSVIGGTSILNILQGVLKGAPGIADLLSTLGGMTQD